MNFPLEIECEYCVGCHNFKGTCDVMKQRKETEKIEHLFSLIDFKLTGKRWEDVQQNTNNQRTLILSNPDSFVACCGVHSLYYLSDGGYSRLFYFIDFDNPENSGIRLTGESRQEVKDKWDHPDCQETIKDINALLLKYAMEEINAEFFKK